MAKILYLAVSDADYQILIKRVRPASNAMVTIGQVTRNAAGAPVLPASTAGQKFDVVIYSPHIGTPGERETMFTTLLY